MGLLDTWTKRAIQRRDSKVEFLGEQSGGAEDTLKRELMLEFIARPDIQRAYLAQIAFQPENERTVALCVVSSRPDDRTLILRVGEICRRRFGKDAALEVVFLTAEQETELARVCQPFYRRPG